MCKIHAVGNETSGASESRSVAHSLRSFESASRIIEAEDLEVLTDAEFILFLYLADGAHTLHTMGGPRLVLSNGKSAKLDRDVHMSLGRKDYITLKSKSRVISVPTRAGLDAFRVQHKSRTGFEFGSDSREVIK